MTKPVRRTAWRPWCALGLVVIAHGQLLVGWRWPTLAPIEAAPAAMVTRVMPADPPRDAQAEVATEAIRRETGDAASTAPTSFDATEPDALAPRPDSTQPNTPPPAPSPDNALPIGALPLAGAGVLRYRFETGDEVGTATLDWSLDHERYSLTLRREAGGRYWPEWHSEGWVRPIGMVPLHHHVERDGKVRERLRFQPDADPPVLRVGTLSHALPSGTQDRLSWWLQLPALAAARPGLRIGESLLMPVAHATGITPWRFVLIARDGPYWRMMREAPREAGRPVLRWTLRLDARRGFLIDQLNFSVDDSTQWALRLLEPPDINSDSDIQVPASGVDL